MRLKILLIHENLPLHYVGNTYKVACQSENTKSLSGNDDFERKYFLIENDWNHVPDTYLGSGLGDDPKEILESLAKEAKDIYRVMDTSTLVILGESRIFISFDACKSFNSWSILDNIPYDLLIEISPEFAECLEQKAKDKMNGITNNSDCTYLWLNGENKPEFYDIIAQDTGYASMKVRSKAFSENTSLSVATENFGKTWKVKLDSSDQSHVPQNSGTPGADDDGLGTIIFKKDPAAFFPFEWEITLSETDMRKLGGQFRIMSELVDRPLIYQAASEEVDELYQAMLIASDKIQPYTGSSVHVKFRLDDKPRLNANGPREYSYLQLSGGFSRIGGLGERMKSNSPPIASYGTSFPIYFFGDRMEGFETFDPKKYVGEKILLAEIKTADQNRIYVYQISLERISVNN